jgi:transposase InsO family protein
MLGQVYLHDAEAGERSLTPEERLRLHQDRSRPVIDKLHMWLEAQLAERRTEPNSGLGQAIGYLLRQWKPLTLFLRQAGAPFDNNIVERSLKRAALHGENALFYRWRVHYNTIRPHSSLGYRPPAPEARLTNDMGHGEVETATRFPLLHTPDGGYLNSEIAAIH